MACAILRGSGVILLGRLLFSLLVVSLLVKLLGKVPDEIFNRFLSRAPAQTRGDA